MAMIASNFAGAPGGCVSPANTSNLLITKANAVNLPSNYTDISEGSGSHAISYFPLDKNIRVLGQSGYGVLKTIGQIQAEAGVANPSSDAGVLATLGSTPGVKVKRPNCECTMLNSFRVWSHANNIPGNENHLGSGLSAYMNTYTFEDGYTISLGCGWFFLKVLNGLNFVNGTSISVGHYVASCMSNGNTADISSGCARITAKTQFDISAGTLGASHFTTSYPKDTFSTSEIRAAIMLENGVYVFQIPAGGTY
tara:strand:- start:1683 stop:2441 length:759 start_codon:yes stop_codon:yes gene_type:complete